MGSETGIEWTDSTWNPVRGCTRVSEGCRNCYAESVAARFSGPGLPYEGLAASTPRGPRWTGQVRLIEDHLEDPIRWKRPRRIFVNSMSDLFHEGLSVGAVQAVFTVMARARRHTFQVLTKRPDRMRDILTQWEHDGLTLREGRGAVLPNVWLGTSVEDRKNKCRIDVLRETPAALRFLSLEPLLQDLGELDLTGIRWVIVGGESGHGARPMHPEWARSIRDQCIAAGVPFFFKQWGEWYGPGNRVGKKAAGSILDGREWKQFPQSPIEPAAGPQQASETFLTKEG